jgi:hypothetical protein
MAMAKPLLLRPVAPSSVYSSRLDLQQFSVLKSHCGMRSLDGSCAARVPSQRLVRAGAWVGEAEGSVVEDVETAGGEVKFERVLETLGRSRALDALEERIAEVDETFGRSIAAGE